jgi:molecular chaperone Hsp33
VHELSLDRRDGAAGDTCLPFVIGDGAIRGRLVRLSDVVHDILSRHADPAPVGELVAQAIVSVVALASGLKYDGIFTFQIQGDGPIGAIVVDLTSGGAVRGCATYDRHRVAAVTAKGRPEHLQPHLLGAGHLTFTVDQGPDTERYQGIVELTGGALVESVHEYFRQSEQLPSALKLSIAPPSALESRWRAGGVLLQRMPSTGHALPADEADDLWRTAVAFLGSATDAEVLDVAVPATRLVHRLFATLGCAPSKPRSFHSRCRCSRERTERILAAFPAHAIKAFADDGVVTMTCEFCRTEYRFTVPDIDAMKRGALDQRQGVNPI